MEGVQKGKNINLKIDSSYIGMESGRTYQSCSTRKLSFRVQIGSTNLNSQLQAGLSNGENALSQGHALDEKNKETLLNQDGEQTKETEEQSQELTDALGKLNQTTSIRNIPRVNRYEEYNAIEDIRQQCLYYLWYIGKNFDS